MCKVQLSWNSVLVARLVRVRKIRSAHTLLARSDPCGMRSKSKQTQLISMNPFPVTIVGKYI